MRKILCFGMLLVGMTAVTISASEVFTYTPDPADIHDLDHYKWYTWGIDVSNLDGLAIEEIELRFENISNYNNGDNVLYLHLLDNATLGISSGNDDQDPADYFDGMGPLIDAWVDENGADASDNLSFLLSERGLINDAQNFVMDGVLGIGFDPDCHFYNDGISLVITASGETAAQKQSWSQLKDLY